MESPLKNFFAELLHQVSEQAPDFKYARGEWSGDKDICLAPVEAVQILATRELLKMQRNHGGMSDAEMRKADLKLDVLDKAKGAILLASIPQEKLGTLSTADLRNLDVCRNGNIIVVKRCR